MNTTTITDGDALWDIVLRDVNGRATQAETATLGATQEAAVEWRDVLTRMLMDADASLAAIKGEVDAHHTKCVAMGDEGKQLHMAYQAEAQKRRARIIAHKARLVERHAEAKALVHGAATQKWTAFQREKEDRMARIEAKLDRILSLLEVES